MSNIYDPPASNLDYEPALGSGLRKFYVVGTLKFWLLFIFTFGAYQLYWLYRNWSRYKASTQENIWPVPRAIFGIFFTHALFREVDATLVGEDREYSWNPGLLATGYVISLIAIRIVDRLPDSMDNVAVPLELFVLYPLVGFLLYRAQRAINVACGDPSGASNARLTWANYAWMSIGFVVIALAVAFGAYAGSH